MAEVYAAQTQRLALIGRQAKFDVAQRFASGQLRKCHHAKQIGAVQGAHPRIATVSSMMRPKVFQRGVAFALDSFDCAKLRRQAQENLPAILNLSGVQ